MVERRAEVLAAIDTAAGLIEAAASSGGTVALACHVNPDGDALGSLLALHLLCRDQGVASVAGWSEPFEVAPHYRYLPGLDTCTKPADYPAEPSLVVTFDCGSLRRLGDLAGPAAWARDHGDLVVVDHHGSNERFGTCNLVDESAAATAVLVRDIAARLGWPLSKDVATCIYTGIVTDTGRFQYASTTPAVFTLAEELSSFGLPLASITRQLFEQHRFAYLQLAGRALARARLRPDTSLVLAWLTAAELVEAHVGVDEAEGLIDIVRRTSEAEVACVCKETPHGVRVSLRSVTHQEPDGTEWGVDVGAIAVELGGGGHRYAAGFELDRPVEEVLQIVEDVVLAAGPPDRPVARKADAGVHGLGVVDKPAGWTSHDVVAKSRGLLGTRKVGHSGTLDPDATGVLLLGVGDVTRLLRFLGDLPKSYSCELVLGVTTSSLDAAGEVTGTFAMEVAPDEVAAAAERFVGRIDQVPPMVSAIQIDGKRLHDLARQGIEVERAARPVTIHSLAVEPTDDPLIYRLAVSCSSGTYVRSLADDIGRALGGGAHLRALRRTSIGPFAVVDATPLEDLTPASVHPPAAAVSHLPAAHVDEAGVAAIAVGKVLPLDDLGITEEGPCAVFAPDGRLLAVYEPFRKGLAKPAVVLASAAT